MSTLLIHGGRLIDPSQNLDRTVDLLVVDGRIARFEGALPAIDERIDATGKIVCPGFVDLHVSHREPGNEEDETTASATAAAVAGGFTSIVTMPDTSPVVDTRAAAEFITLQAARAGHCHVFPLGAVTKSQEGRELAEIGQLVDGGAVGFTDAKRPVANAEIMRRALEYSRMFDRPIFNHPQVPELVANGVMHEGRWSMKLGLRGMPAASEEIMVARDIALARLTGGHVHLMCVSTRAGIELVRHAKAEGVRVTCDVTPHHLALTDADLKEYDSNFKVDPPLRTLVDVEALIAGLRSGVIDAISSDHQPHAEEKKAGELDQTPFGIVGLETLLPVCVKTLIEPGHLDWMQLLRFLTTGPARVIGIEKGTLAEGADADIAIIDPHLEWTIDPARFRSNSRNTPFRNWKVRGRATTVVVGGKVRNTL